MRSFEGWKYRGGGEVHFDEDPDDDLHLCWQKGEHDGFHKLFNANFNCTSHGATDALARTMLRTASEEMATSTGINYWTTSTGAGHIDRD